MITRVDSESTVFDTVKLLLAAAILLGGITGYYYYGDVSVLIRAIGLLLSLVAATLVCLQTVRGRLLWRFIQGSRVELRKVVWPNREETIQTTVAVLVFAMLMGVFFWLLDLFLLWCTRLLTGQGA